MTKTFKTAFIIFLFILLLSPSLLFAEDELYDTPGFDPYRETFSLTDFEHIDPFTGGLILNFEDVRIPGNGGLDLVVQRTYNSKNVCKGWMDVGGDAVCAVGGLAEDSWVGLGWTLHYGKLLFPFSINLNPIIEMPDGSQHEAYNKVGSSDYITKDYWILKNLATPELTFTDGRKIFFGNYTTVTIGGNLYKEYYATEITDTNGNSIDIYYKTGSNYVEGTIDYIKEAKSPYRKITFYHKLVGGKYRLWKITRPDNKYIEFDYYNLTNENRVLLTRVKPPVGNSWKYEYNTSGSLAIHDIIKLTTPYGGIIEYAYGTSKLWFGPYDNYYRGFRTVKQKKTSGRDVPSGTWNFSYFQSTNKEYTIITDPCGRTIKYRHYGYDSGLGDGEMWKIGLPISKEIVGEEKTTYEWIPSPYISYDDYWISVWKDLYIYAPYLSKRTIERDGQTYTTTYSNHDSYGNPKTISESGDKTRTRSLSYWYNTTKNIVKGKPSTETVSGSFAGSFTADYT